MNQNLTREFLYQAFALLAAVLVVHLIYVAIIRPNADEILIEREALMDAGQPPQVERSMYVVLRDYEQETCFILMIWAVAIMGFKARTSLREWRLLKEDLVPAGEGISILPEDTRTYARPVQALEDGADGYLLPRALLAALQRFASTHNVQDVSEAVRSVCDAEAERLESELSMVRYIAWAIPSIGFIGTVRGIGDALGQAHEAVQGDIAGVTESLGVAFNSTFVALVLSIVLMFLLHQLQLVQERLVLDTQNYCDQRLIRHMQVR